MTFQEWFNSAPHRTKYSSDHPAYLAAQEAWNAAHEACAKECDELAGILFCYGDKSGSEIAVSLRDTIRERSNT